MSQKAIRVLIVDDSPLARAVLQRMLSNAPNIEVVGTAANGREALELIPRLEPTLICTDFHMPQMDGLELTRQVMAQFPRPILVISSAVDKTDAERVFALLEAGAVDVFPKPRGGPEAEELATAQLIQKVTVAAGVWVRARPGGKPGERSNAPSPVSAVLSPRVPAAPQMSIQRTIARPRIVAIGASTGGPQAFQTILAQLPLHFPLPVVCVQHIGSGFLTGFVNWLGAHCCGKVVIARNGDVPQRGHIYFPQENTHLIIDHQGLLQASCEPPVGGHRPSVTVTFRSVAEYYKSAVIGVLLTGMGRDGGEGMQAIAEAGGQTIAQDEATSVIYGMPRDAVERGAAGSVLPLHEIASALIKSASPLSPGSARRI